MAYLVIQTLNLFMRALEILIFVRVIMSWVPGLNRNSFIPRLVYGLTEPILAPIRNLLMRTPLSGLMIDFSPVIAMLLLDVVFRAIIRIIFTFLI